MGKTSMIAETASLRHHFNTDPEGSTHFVISTLANTYIVTGR
jgi:hypothetical protein